MPHPPEILNYHEIVDGIYVGTNQCCQTHFSEELLTKGIRADISLEKDRVDAPFGVDFYTWIPIEDHSAPTPTQFDFGVATITKLVAMGEKIYIHCKNGHGRAPTLVAAYLISANGESPESAEALIKQARPVMHLWDVQRDALQAFALRMKK